VIFALPHMGNYELTGVWVIAKGAGSVTTVRAIRRADLKPGLTFPQAADLLWTLTSPETYDLLVMQRSWPMERFTHWLTEALATSLLRTPG
jgi:hypothetical protein